MSAVARGSPPRNALAEYAICPAGRVPTSARGVGLYVFSASAVGVLSANWASPCMASPSGRNSAARTAAVPCSATWNAASITPLSCSSWALLTPWTVSPLRNRSATDLNRLSWSPYRAFTSRTLMNNPTSASRNARAVSAESSFATPPISPFTYCVAVALSDVTATYPFRLTR